MGGHGAIASATGSSQDLHVLMYPEIHLMHPLTHSLVMLTGDTEVTCSTDDADAEQVLRSDLLHGTLLARRTSARLPAHETRTQCSCLLGHAQVISSGSCYPNTRRERRRRADAHGMARPWRRESWVKQGRVAAVRSAPAR